MIHLDFKDLFEYNHGFELFRFKEGLSVAKDENGLYGYMDMDGNIKIPCQFKKAFSFDRGLAIVRLQNDDWAVIDKESNLKFVFPMKFYDAPYFSEDFIVARCAESVFLFDRITGKITGTPYPHTLGFSEGLCTVELPDSSWGFINKKLKLIFKTSPRRMEYFLYNTAGIFNEGLAPVFEGGKWGYVNKTGKLVIPYQFKNARSFSEGLAAVQNEENLWGYMNKAGKLVIPYQFKYAADFSEGLASVQTKNGRYTYINKTGGLVTQDSFRQAHRFSEGLAAVQNEENLWGYMNKAGKLVIPYQFETAYNFSEGLAVVKKPKGPCECIDKIGNIKITPGKIYISVLDTGYETIFITANSKEELYEKKIGVLEQVELEFMHRIENQINASLSDIMCDLYDESTKDDKSVKKYQKSRNLRPID